MVARWDGDEPLVFVDAEGVAAGVVVAVTVAAGRIAADRLIEDRLAEDRLCGEEEEADSNTAGGVGSSTEQRCRWEQRSDQRRDLTNLI